MSKHIKLTTTSSFMAQAPSTIKAMSSIECSAETATCKMGKARLVCDLLGNKGTSIERRFTLTDEDCNDSFEVEARADWLMVNAWRWHDPPSMFTSSDSATRHKTCEHDTSTTSSFPCSTNERRVLCTSADKKKNTVVCLTRDLVVEEMGKAKGTRRDMLSSLMTGF